MRQIIDLYSVKKTPETLSNHLFYCYLLENLDLSFSFQKSSSFAAYYVLRTINALSIILVCHIR